VTLDPENGLLFVSDPSGMLVAHRLSDGRKAFAVPLALGPAYDRRYAARRGTRWLVVSTETALDPHATEPPENSMVEIVDLGDPPEPDPDGFLLSAVGQGDLVRKTLRLLPALRDSTLVLATEGRVYVLDTELAIESALEGDFVPLALSLDEEARPHLVVRRAGELTLWVLTQAGERIAEATLPLELAPIAPPVIAHSHEVLVAARDRVLAFDPDGAALWEFRGDVAGAVVTADDRVLVATGSEVLAIETGGVCRRLAEFRGERLRTPPALADDGALYVASERTLHRLEARVRSGWPRA
jgi:hypothetical protein